MVTPAHTKEEILGILETVKDPEIPSVSVVDLGIVRDVSIQNSKVTVTITPTYSGCPALHMIEQEICQTLKDKGYEVAVAMQYSPAWTTDWMSEKGRTAMKESGIAPPCRSADTALVKFPWEKKQNDIVACPFCNSHLTTCKSEFGSTACKSLHYCEACHQPFDYFKPF